MSVNRVILVGNVGQDPRVKYFDTGSAVATFPLATTDRGYTLANGTQIPERTEWHNIVASNRLAEIVDKYVHKGDKLYLEGKVLELLSLFCDEAIGKQKNTKDISREDYRCLMKAREIIDNHFLHPLTIAQIAEQCFLSETKLKHGFKICFNCTVYEYIVEKRMEMAYRLLQSGKYKVKDVVWMVGYTNASHFIDAFKKRYGVTPGEI